MQLLKNHSWMIFGFEANVKKMMKGCTVISIEDELQEFMLTSATKKTQTEEKAKPHKALLPLSKTQLGVYLDCIKNPYNTLYNIPSILTFPKNFDADKLANCVKEVLKAHPYIFTSLTTENNEVEQRYIDSAEPEVSVVTLSEEQLAYQNMAHGQKAFAVGKNNAYTMQVLYRMGFKWPVTSLDFMKRFIGALSGLGYFN